MTTTSTTDAFSRRNLAIDMLRAITMFTMIFVNDFWKIHDVPHWLEHAAYGEDFMGLADVVFPCFLFAVGMSIPYAIERRYAKGCSAESTVGHILTRTLWLIVMGCFIGNSEARVAADSLYPIGVYWLLMLVGRLVGGAIGGSVSSRAMLTFTTAVAIILIALGICLGQSPAPFFGFDASKFEFFSCTIPVNAICFICVGLCTSVMWGAIFNLSVEGLGKYTDVASGLFMVMVCGGGIFPLIQASIPDILNSFWLPAGLCFYMLIYALFLSYPSKKNLGDEHVYENNKRVEA